MGILETIGIAWAIALVWMSLMFLLALALKKNDIADIAWGLGFIVVSVTTALYLKTDGWVNYLILGLVLAWGVRLGIYIFIRNRGKKEDWRYNKWRQQWGKHFLVRSYLQVFVLQGTLMTVVLTPVLIAARSTLDEFNILIIIGGILWALGFFFEAVGDAQLFRFIKNPDNKDRIMQSGLWKYTRHPNYFGEICMWWGIGLIALLALDGWIGLLGPLVITYLLIFVSGIPMLEKRYKDDAAFQEYAKQTSVLIPWFPKKNI